MAKTELEDGSGEEGHALTHITVTGGEEEEESHSEDKSASVASEHRV